MKKQREECGDPRNPNPIGKYGHGRRIGQDWGRVTFIQEYIARVESEAFTSWSHSQRMTS